MKTVLLTGGAGFLGSHLLEALLEQGNEVVLLKRSTSDTWRIGHLLDQVRAYDVDQVPLEQAFKDQQIDVVIHTACSYGRHGQSAHEVVETNLLFSLRLLDAATSHNAGAFFNTDTLLPRDLNTYTLSKKQFVEWLAQRSRQLQVVNLKIEHMYGPKDDDTKFVPWLIGQLKKNVTRIPLTEGRQLRDFIYIDDVVSAYMMLLEKAEKLPAFNDFDVGTGTLIPVRDFVTALHTAYKHQDPHSQTVLGFGDVPLRAGEMLSVEVDNSALSQHGWAAQYAVPQGIDQLFGKER